MTLTEQQIKKANILLDELCKNRELEAEQVYSIFDSKTDAEYVCTVLEKKELLHAAWVEGHEIFAIRVTVGTCNAVANSLLDKELIPRAKLNIKEQLELDILNLQKESLEYNLTIRKQQDRIRNLEEQTKFIELLKGYWWVLLICIGIGAGLLELWDTVVP
jgi:hypothetical protein